MDIKTRIRALSMLANFTGTDVSAKFLRKPLEHLPQIGIPIIHNLVEGIYKPASDRYAFSIWSRSASGVDIEVYPDRFRREADGSWTIKYSAKRGSLETAANKSLFTCMRDKVPVLVIVTSAKSNYSRGTRYRIMGPALIEQFDQASRMFMMRGYSEAIFRQIADNESVQDAAIYEIRSSLILPFQIGENRARYQVGHAIRDNAFRLIILDEYRCQCVVCQSKFLLRQNNTNDLIEAEAAHIVPVEDKGPDDPRNGLSLCRRHHWAFDNGLFTVTDIKTIKVSLAVQRAERRRFDLEEYEGQSIVGPASDICRPADEALHHHQSKIYLKT
jgi:predicted restriction endonuclease